MAYHKGLKRSTPSRVQHRLGAHLDPRIAAALATEPSGAADLTRFWTQPFDQSRSSTCHAHSAITCAYVAMAAAGKTFSWMPSPLELASCVYADMRAAATPVGQPLPLLYDTGAELQDDADAVTKWGLAPIGPLQGRFSDVPDDPPDNSFPEPQLTALQGAVRFSGEYAIPVDGNAPRIVAACLDAGIPVQSGGPVGELFEGNTDPTVAIGADPTASDGHAMAILAYRTKAPAALSAFAWEFFEESSWGPFGVKGGRWVTGEWMLSQWSLWPYPVVQS